MQLQRFIIAGKEQGPLDWDADSATQLLVVNIGAKNKFEGRGAMDSHAYQNQDVHNPPVEFSRFLDGESFMQEDLVLKLNGYAAYLITSARTGI
ncbi:hypothetical protein MCOR02_002908 [Pyricularia oryzae]|uniref:Uncharacterized protein n=2 Tax=Pyricularia TaxID=48558 RepID=A0ABQ8NZH2_PYRGI|nr:hypothetical protein MCOR01_008691 [Pyricularia oryzae]KAI6303075.1 hypothetical protein MCOR33_001672 [Pyricularia grisea]KAH9439349.1 hypothetical protein MCOR02_002908 [Pyricularia oryzae]KAI6252655.1 hypothetical protein MCOR19_010741 [Pyricularia oryzae]KAI6308329.1 hypothetical protein MCOR34_007260 [Pyricularia oryzae]